MKRYSRIPIALVFAIGILVIGMSHDAEAGFVLTLDDLSTAGVDVIVWDNGGLDSDSAPNPASIAGMIVYVGRVGNFWTSVTTSLSKPFLPSVSQAKIDLNTVDVSGYSDPTDPNNPPWPGPTTLEIKVVDNGFVLPGQGTLPMVLRNSVGGTTDGIVTTQGYLDATNAQWPVLPVTQTTGLLGPFDPVAPLVSFSGEAVNVALAPLVAGQPFSLMEVVNITHNNLGDITSLDKELTAEPIPEPGTLLLLGSGLLGMAGYAKLKLKRRRT